MHSYVIKYIYCLSSGYIYFLPHVLACSSFYIITIIQTFFFLLLFSLTKCLLEIPTIRSSLYSDEVYLNSLYSGSFLLDKVL